MRQRSVALLWLGGLISFAGDWVLLIGLPIYIYTVTGSTLATSAMFLSGLLPTLLFGSVAGVFADRWDRCRILIVVDILFALGLLPLLLVHSTGQIWIVYLVQFVESSLAQFAGPAVSALIPLLVDESQLPTLNSLNSLSLHMARLSGPVLGGFLVGRLGLTGVALADAVSFLVAALLLGFIRLPSSRAHHLSLVESIAEGQRWTAVWTEWWEGLRLVRSTKRLHVIFAVMAITGIGEGILSTLYAPFVINVLHGTPVTYGLLNSGQAVGGLIGSAVAGYFGPRTTPTRMAVLGFLGLGAVDLLLFDYSLIVSGVLPALILIIAAGIPAAVSWVNFITLLQTSVGDIYRGRISGAFSTTESGGRLVGTALAGVLGERAGVLPLLNLQAASLVIGGLLLWLTLGREPQAYKHTARPESGSEGRG